jgi:hypothetical protein|tara:strand:+ start:74 stop:211 length:138 start_codon:yes stop_codon:yes gene_type:complete
VLVVLRFIPILTMVVREELVELLHGVQLTLVAEVVVVLIVPQELV